MKKLSNKPGKYKLIIAGIIIAVVFIIFIVWLKYVNFGPLPPYVVKKGSLEYTEVQIQRELVSNPEIKASILPMEITAKRDFEQTLILGVTNRENKNLIFKIKFVGLTFNSEYINDPKTLDNISNWFYVSNNLQKLDLQSTITKKIKLNVPSNAKEGIYKIAVKIIKLTNESDSQEQIYDQKDFSLMVV